MLGQPPAQVYVHPNLASIGRLHMALLCDYDAAGDLGNLDLLDPETAAKLPALMRLKAALYRRV